MKFKLKLTGIVGMAAVMAVASVFGLSDGASAQSPPEIKVIIFQGNVTVAGEPAPDGMKVTARIGSNYESEPVFTGATSSGRYVGLVAEYVPRVPSDPGQEEWNELGQTIQFWLEDQVLSQQTSFLAPPNPSTGAPCPGCGWTLPLIRTVDLSFNTAPIATATPTLTPTATQFVVQPAFFGGRIVAGAQVPPDGYEVFARIGSYETMKTTIQDGRYGIVLDPQHEDSIGQQVTFHMGGFQAVQQAVFQPGVFNDAFNLVFSGLPTATPTVTPTPSHTPTPEPTRTATPAPSPTPTVTPTATPTMTSGQIATATALAAPDEPGGSCNGGGAASFGMVGLLMAPFGLYVVRRMKKARGTEADD